MNNILAFVGVGFIVLFIYEYVIYTIIMKKLNHYFKKVCYSIEEYLYNTLKGNGIDVDFPDYLDSLGTYNHDD